MKKQYIQIGTSTYNIDTPENVMEAIKSVVIYHQGELDTLKLWTKSALGENQEAYISYNMMEAGATTNKCDMADTEFYFITQATRMGDDSCKEWLKSELSGE